MHCIQGHELTIAHRPSSIVWRGTRYYIMAYTLRCNICHVDTSTTDIDNLNMAQVHIQAQHMDQPFMPVGITIFNHVIEQPLTSTGK